MPAILFAALVVLALLTLTPATAAASVIGVATMVAAYNWGCVEADHHAAGTPWQYRPTLWVILFLTFVSLLIYGKLC